MENLPLNVLPDAAPLLPAIPPLDPPEPSNGKTFWFSAGVFWLILFAEIFDEVRHHDENLFIVFPTLIWLIVTASSLGLVRWVSWKFPDMALYRTNEELSHRPVVIGFFSGLTLAVVWGHSPLYSFCYDSIKWMLLLVTAGWLLGLIYKLGGRRNVGTALLFSWLAGVVTMLIYLGLGMLDSPSEPWRVAWGLGAIGLPYTLAVTLYDCSQRALIRRE